MTIVVIPFIALQQDLFRRCRELSITYNIWSAWEVNLASIVLITPESLTTRGFRDFANRLLIRKQLDRIVFNECYTLLDTSYNFRPQLWSISDTLL